MRAGKLVWIRVEALVPEPLELAQTGLEKLTLYV
jgi:hypothetical protein